VKKLIRSQIIAIIAMIVCFMIAAGLGAGLMLASLLAMACGNAAAAVVYEAYIFESTLFAVTLPAWIIGLYARTGHGVTPAGIITLTAAAAVIVSAIFIRALSRDLKLKFVPVFASFALTGFAFGGTLGCDSPLPAAAGVIGLVVLNRLTRTKETK